MSILEADVSGGWVLLCFLMGGMLAFLATSWSRSRRARNRANDGFEAESRAIAFLEKRGFSVLDSPCNLPVEMWVDGEALSASVRADFLVQKNGEKYIVEVKSTERAGNPMFPDTRRQLREYAQLSSYPVLLLDMSRGELMRIEFEAPGKSSSLGLENRSRIGMMAAGMVGLIVGWFCHFLSNSM